MAEQGKLTRARNVISRSTVNGVVVLVRTDNDRCFYELDGVAAEFWNLVDGRRTAEAICSILMKRHDVTKAELNKEVARLLSDLRKHSLLASQT